ncbi:hypothetical protein P280DRAFT_542837 [Massarina eburnea CBS 473.64]|uniref:ATPase AAA-type core domain-containing protein n=1 Tax=Massarina eburnea CBS 473.64 TaxID=1395130 RepID=A0A6A6S2G9_9PLEO|nr:hypothetical protein P280DRAFT_542837 [Massarina eburnea CBS 473.64]
MLSSRSVNSSSNLAFDVVVSGKGHGHITLFSRPLGVGKTLTAKLVASTLQIITKWRAVFLIDECDVFLETRSVHELERNRIVSIFPRVLEYYRGFLFLTTNRFDNIDLAFYACIHVSMGLDIEQEWSDGDRYQLAMVKLNGRQTKNTLRSAALLTQRAIISSPLILDIVNCELQVL